MEEFAAVQRKVATVFVQQTLSHDVLLTNYGERYRSGERISSAMAESTVNALVSKRFAKRQQMQWTKRGAHLLLQGSLENSDIGVR